MLCYKMNLHKIPDTDIILGEDHLREIIFRLWCLIRNALRSVSDSLSISFEIEL